MSYLEELSEPRTVEACQKEEEEKKNHHSSSPLQDKYKPNQLRSNFSHFSMCDVCHFHTCKFETSAQTAGSSTRSTPHKKMHSFWDLSPKMISLYQDSGLCSWSPLPPAAAPLVFQVIAAKGKLANNTLCSHSLTDANRTRHANASQAGQTPAFPLIFP